MLRKRTHVAKGILAYIADVYAPDSGGNGNGGGGSGSRVNAASNGNMHPADQFFRSLKEAAPGTPYQVVLDALLEARFFHRCNNRVAAAEV